MIKYRIVLTFIVILFCNYIYGQFYTIGEDPASTKWNIIKGNNYNVIYPCEIDSLAIRYYFILEKYRPAVFGGMKVNPKKIPVVLHPYTSISNGLVVWAPKRMELFTIPPANNSYAQNWEEQLVMHELRHEGQMAYFTKGFFKPLGWLIGQQSTGIGVAIYPNVWMMEGDAVVTETELSNTGRGRSANFMAYYRAAFLNGDYRTWNKWRFGSVKRYSPDPYSLGYLINSSIRYRTGNFSYYGDIADITVKNFFNPFVKGYSFKKITGLNVRENFKAATELMTSIWRADYEARGKKTEPLFLTTPSNKFFIDYRGTTGNDSSIYYIMSGYDMPAYLVKFSNGDSDVHKYGSGKGKKLRTFSNYSGIGLQCANGKIFWTEPIQDARWSLRNYSDLFSYDIVTEKVERLSFRQYYYNPSLSVSGDTIAVTEYSIKGGTCLSLIDYATEKKIYSFDAPLNGQILESAWLGNRIFCTVITRMGLGVYSVNVENGEWIRVIKEQNQNIKYLRYSKNCEKNLLYFCSDMDGVDNIYAYDINAEDLFRLTNSEYGAGSPLIVENDLFYTETMLAGNYPARIDISGIIGDRGKSKLINAKTAFSAADDADYKVDRIKEDKQARNDIYIEDGDIKNIYKYEIADTLSAQANRYLKAAGITSPNDNEFINNINVENEVTDGLTIKPYKKLSNLFRVHSWAPLYYNVDKISQMSYDKLYEVAGIGATVYSQNSLGTAVTMLGYSYRKGDSPVKNNFHAGHLSFTYSGLYPVFELKADVNNNDRHKVFLDKNERDNFIIDSISFLKSPLTEIELRTYIPFVFNKNGWQRGVIPQISWKFKNNLYYDIKSDKFVTSQSVKAILQAYLMRPVAKAAVFPRYGIGMMAKTNVPTSGASLFSSSVAGRVYFYLPGIGKTHGMKFGIGYEKQFIEGKAYYEDNLMDVPRGYDNIVSNKLFKLSFDYALPIGLNHGDLGYFAYFQRLQLIPFVDYARYERRNVSGDLLSIGGDVLLDGYFFRIGAPISIGFRYAHLKKDNIYGDSSGYFSLLFNISL